jgi:hypothetical protein
MLFMYFVALSEFVKVFLYEIRSESVTMSLVCSEESLGLLRFLLVERLEFEEVVEFELEVAVEFELEDEFEVMVEFNLKVEAKFAASLPILLKGLSGFVVKSILLSMTVGLGLRVVAVVRFFLGLVVVVVLKSTLLSTVGLGFTVVVVVVDGFGRAVTMRGPSISKSRLAIGWSETPCGFSNVFCPTVKKMSSLV